MEKRKNMKTGELARMLALIAGGMDLATGVGLVFAPAWTLGWMQVTPPGVEALIFLRWVGAFVGAVGASYLVAWGRGGALCLREVFISTLWFRAAAGGYCLAEVLAGGLEVRWLVVAATDFTLVGAQILLLRRRGWSDV